MVLTNIGIQQTTKGVLQMKTVTKLVLGAVGLQAVMVGVAAVRYAKIKHDLRTGKVDGWIKDVVGDVPFEIKSTIPVPAYIEDDASKIYFRLSNEDLMMVAASTVSFKTAIQAIAAHEKGHAVDEVLTIRQDFVKKALMRRDYEEYSKQVIRREKAAWELGREFAPNKKYFDSYNKANLKAYRAQLLVEKLTRF